jgi:hypothetical protein
MKFRTAIVRSAFLVPTIGTVATHAQAQTYLTSQGTSAAIFNTTGAENSAFGHAALKYNTTGSQNTAIGSTSLWKNTTMSNNTAVGFEALKYNDRGYQNTAVGSGANTSNTSGYDNTAIGYEALKGNTTGVGNTGLGSGTLGYDLSSYNTAVGGLANTGCTASTCIHTVAVGYGSSAAQYSTAVGGPTPISPPATIPQGFVKASGSYAVAVGNGAWATATYSTAIGYGAWASGTNSMALGYNAKNSAANTVRIGNTDVGTIIGSATVVNLSDGRYKTSVKEDVPGLAFITKLRPITFKWDLAKLGSLDGAEPLASDPILGEAREAKARKVNTGFIAQEVEAAARECGYDFSGVVKPENEQSQYQLGYSEFVVPLVKAVQEQQKEIDELRQALRTLATDGRLPGDRFGQASAQPAAQHAGMLDNFWASAMTLLSAALVVLHFTRRGTSPVPR